MQRHASSSALISHPSCQCDLHSAGRGSYHSAQPRRFTAFHSQQPAADPCRHTCSHSHRPQRSAAASSWRSNVHTEGCSSGGGTGGDVCGPSRRSALLLAPASVVAALCAPEQAAASRLPPALDRAWEAIGGGPSDLIFPELFLGRWVATSTLVKLETPLGTDQLPPALVRVVQRAREEDLNHDIQYGVRWIRNMQGQLVIDRAYNMVHLLNMYMGRNPISSEDVSWDVTNPNQLSVRLRGGTRADTRVTRRSQDQVSDDRIDTSEFYQQTIFTSDTGEPRVKASQCFTKYKYRDDAASGDGGPGIVATQVVSDYLTSFDDQAAYLQSRNRPVVVYTYRMSFRRDAAQPQLQQQQQQPAARVADA